MLKDIKKRTSDKMEQTINVLKKELGSIRTGRASLSLLEGISVNYYGTNMPIQQVATLSVPESRLIVIQPWDTKLIPEIEKAIHSSGLGLNPSNDGKVIRVPIPQLTEERRKELVKLVKRIGEDSRVAIRNIRRESNEETKRIAKEASLSEDDVRRFQDEIQKLTNQYIHRIDDLLAKKEREIMEV